MVKNNKKSYKKRASSTKKIVKKAKLSRLVKLIKKVSLKAAETKNTHQIEENIDLYHNGQNLKTNLLYTRQGITDGNTGTSYYSNRIGDEVICRGLQLKFWFATKNDRPNVMFKVVVFRYYSQSTAPTTIFKSQGSSNLMIRDIDIEKLKVIKVKMFNLNTGNMVEQGSGGTANWQRKEAHKYMKIYLPLKNQKIKYIADDSGTPMKSDIGFCVIAYDSYGTLTTDIIASYAYNCKFYFKDP